MASKKRAPKKATKAPGMPKGNRMPPKKMPMSKRDMMMDRRMGMAD